MGGEVHGRNNKVSYWLWRLVMDKRQKSLNEFLEWKLQKTGNDNRGRFPKSKLIFFGIPNKKFNFHSPPSFFHCASPNTPKAQKDN
jgi:hypothetical protein